MSAIPPRLGRVAIALHVTALAGTFAALAAWTWGTWPDVVVDFGRELYVPWQLSRGRQLYNDVAYFNGPLSPHWNALLFRVFGVGLSTLVWSNLALFALLLALLHCVLRSISSPLAATAACIVVMCTCGFGQLVGIGNYNFVCPYSHEATHGLLLGVAALACVQRAEQGRAWIVLGGACVGLAFLTKPETFVAALAGVGAALALRPHAARAAMAAAAAALASVVVAWVWIAVASSPALASKAILGAWPSLIASEVSELSFYRAGMGLDAPGKNVFAMLAWGAGALALLVPSVLCARFIAPPLGPTIAAVAAFVSTGVAMAALHARVPWLQAARPWPLFALAMTLAAFARWRTRRDERSASTFAFALFALAMLAKMLLNARLMNYGFALAMPATALVVVAAFDTLPRAFSRIPRVRTQGGLPRRDALSRDVERARANGAALRAGAAALAIAFCSIHLHVASKLLARKQELVGVGADRFRADLRGRYVNAALHWIAENVGSKRPTLAVMPEGVTLNYLARLDNPTPYINFMPPEFELFGEPNIVAAFDARTPDVVLLVHKSTAEYGLPWFGRDYARDLWRWLGERYQPAALFGDQPLQAGSSFGILVLVRKR